MLRKTVVAAAITSIILAACRGSHDHSNNGAVKPQLFAQTNDSTNAVLFFTRNADGTLSNGVKILTGGKGTGGVTFANGGTIDPDSLTSDNSVIVSPDGSRLFVANPGDNTVSVFSIDRNGGNPTLLATSSTGGVLPTSLAFANGVLYVTHQQGSQQLGAYRVGSNGKLTQIGQYTTIQPNVLPTQVAVSTDGKFVLVDVRSLATGGTAAANTTLITYPVNIDGTLGTAVSTPPAGQGSFAARFGVGGLARLLVSLEVVSNSAASYQLADNGTLTILSGPLTVPGNGAPCWLSLTPDNRFAYVGNGSGTISSYSIDSSGHLTLLNGNAATEARATATVSSFAEDSWVSPDSKFLYQDFPGDDKIVVYSIGTDGSLTKINEQPANAVSKITL